jgi:hypothetical protein
MKRLFNRLPSPALVVAVIALVAALAGTSIALPGRSTVDGGDIINGTVRTEDVRNGSLTDRDIARRSFRGTRFRIESVGGNAVKEQVLEVEKLRKVPAAALADLANSAGNADNLDGKDSAAFVEEAELLWALVDADAGAASVVRGRGATGASSPGTGRYVVTFNRDITGCGVTATLGDAAGAAGPDGEISTDQPAGNAIEINTSDSAGAPENPLATDGFTVQIIC